VKDGHIQGMPQWRLSANSGRNASRFFGRNSAKPSGSRIPMRCCPPFMAARRFSTSAEVRLKSSLSIAHGSADVETGEVGHGTMRRQDDQAGIGHVHQRGHYEFRRRVRIGLARCRAALVSIRQRGLVTVVSIRDVEVRVAKRILSRLDGCGIADFQSLFTTP